MLEISDEHFQTLIDKALTELPGEHVKNIKNVAILYEIDPTLQQREVSHLRNDQTLLGLYEGVPLTERQGMSRVLPDKITLFKNPLLHMVQTEQQLLQEIKHTLWHEIGHYYGLNHTQIRALE
ncbi:MAG: metallopeptidase family protein [Patescibacteria group bacterium]|nr:metallopeptidase family protein [Patescibacteria group bacterium]